MCKFYTLFGKRAFDILASLIGLICLLPVFFTIAIAVKVTSKGPIFYVQERLGKNFRPFKMLKFRSMVINNAQNHSLVTAKRDARITPLGSLLRAYKLDELPQLLNVLKGDMSLVGPRPEVERYINHYKSDYEFILKIKPGITDNAAIAFKNEEDILQKYDNPQDAYIQKIMPQKIQLYKNYINNISFFSDIKLILKTIF